MKYKFYMQKCLKDGTPIAGTLKDLEEDFEGLRYSKCVGINQIGQAQNIYEETFSEADGVKIYIPDKVTHKSTTITLTLYFFGENRQRTYDKFNKYISDGFLKFWDTARSKGFIFCVKDTINISESMWYSGTPYIKCDYKLYNILGKTFDV